MNNHKIVLRLKDDLYESMRKLASQRQTSMHGLLVDLCTEACSRELVSSHEQRPPT